MLIFNLVSSESFTPFLLLGFPFLDSLIFLFVSSVLGLPIFASLPYLMPTVRHHCKKPSYNASADINPNIACLGYHNHLYLFTDLIPQGTVNHKATTHP